MMKRVPMSLASRHGVSRLASDASEARIALTNHGRIVAVVDSAERLDEDARKMREAAAVVLDSAAERLYDRSAHFSLEDACARLGISPDRVRARADEMRQGR